MTSHYRNNKRLQATTTTDAAAFALATTVFLMSIETVKSFAHQTQQSATLQCLTMMSGYLKPTITALSASSFAHKAAFAPPEVPKVLRNVVASTDILKTRCLTTSLSMSWSMDTMQSPFRSFGSWYNEVEPIATNTVYTNEDNPANGILDLSLGSSSSDDWLIYNTDRDNSMYSYSGMMSDSSEDYYSGGRRTPFKAIRRLTRAAFGLVRPTLRDV